MRSFSNIMPNFADKLHLLVDSILLKKMIRAREKKANFFGKSVFFINFAP